MKNTLLIYIVMGILFIAPLVLFNIKKIWIRKPPNPVKFKPVRFTIITLMSVIVVAFLIAAYQATLKIRYEIATERAAAKQAEAIVGNISMTDFRDFIIENGTEAVAASFDATGFPDYGDVQSVSFQLSDECKPKNWEGKDGFEQVEVINEENPIYVMYMLKTGDRTDYYVLRLKNTDSGWKYDWIGNASDVQKNKIDMPSPINGQWYTVTKK